MEIITKKTATHLTIDSVSILTQQVYYVLEKEMQIVDEELKEVEIQKEYQVGENHRCSYTNTENGRTELIANEPEEIVAEVMTVWGDTSIVEEEPAFDKNYVSEPTTEELLNALLGLEE